MLLIGFYTGARLGTITTLRVNALFDAMSMAATYGYRQSTSGLLAWGYYGGNVTLTDGSLLAVANSIINIPANGTNYLVASKATGVVSVSQSITNWNDLANYWRLYLITSSNVSVTGYTDYREFGKFAGVDANKVPSAQLPSYVDDVLEYANLAAFPATGATGVIYVAIDTNKTYRWSGSAYVYITSGGVDSVNGLTGVVTLGTMSSQDATAVNIDGGTIDGTVIGGTTKAAGSFTALSATGNTTLGDASTDTVTVNGYMGVGGAGGSDAGITVVSNELVGTSQKGALFSPTFSSAATNTAYAAMTYPQTAISSATHVLVAGMRMFDAVKGAGSTISNLHGLIINDQTQGTNNYGITSAVTSGTNKWNIYASGTADNYFAGNVGIGTAYPFSKFDTSAPNAVTNSNGIVGIYSNDTAGANLGGSLQFGGSYTGTTKTQWAQIAGRKENATAGETAGYLAFATRVNGGGTTERMRIDSAGNVGIGVTPTTRNNTTLQIKDGIGFPATQVASTDANTLDDYEEGDWPFAIVGSTTAGVGTYTNTPVGRYTKIGNRVFIHGNATWTAHTGTGNLEISGLPFPIKNALLHEPVYTVYSTDIALTASNTITAISSVNTTTVKVRQLPVGGGAQTAVPIDTAGQIIISGHYEV